jgi:hypothetical protein
MDIGSVGLVFGEARNLVGAGALPDQEGGDARGAAAARGGLGGGRDRLEERVDVVGGPDEVALEERP